MAKPYAGCQVGTGHLFWVRSNFIALVKSKMFGITLDRHTWMQELSWELFVNGAQCMSNIVPLLDLLGTINDLIPEKRCPVPTAGHLATMVKVFWATARRLVNRKGIDRFTQRTVLTILRTALLETEGF